MNIEELVWGVALLWNWFINVVLILPFNDKLECPRDLCTRYDDRFAIYPSTPCSKISVAKDLTNQHRLLGLKGGEVDTAGLCLRRRH